MTGESFLDPGQCSTDPVITFDYGNGIASVCQLITFGNTQIVCRVPPGSGTPRIVVNICGQLARDLPRFGPDTFFWALANVPNDLNWCSKVTGPSNGRWNNAYFCSKDTRAKQAAVSSVGTPIFRYVAGATAPGGFRCVALTSSLAGWPAGMICVTSVSPYVLTWSQSGPINGMMCTPWTNSLEPVWNNTNHQLCAPAGSSPWPVTDVNFVYRYAAPNITTVTPGNGPTTGNVPITIRGKYIRSQH